MRLSASSVPTQEGNLNCFTGKSFPCGAACFSLNANCQRIVPEIQKQKMLKLQQELMQNKIKKSTRPVQKATNSVSGSPLPTSKYNVSKESLSPIKLA